MMMRGLWIICVVWASLCCSLADTSACAAADHPDCRCDFTDTSTDMKSRALAGTIGALTPLLVTGAGLVVWRLVKQCRSGGDSRLPSSTEGSGSELDTAGDNAWDEPDEQPESRPESVASVTDGISLDMDTPSGRDNPIRLFDHDDNPYLDSRFSTFIDPRGSPSIQYSRPRFNTNTGDINAWMNNRRETDA